MFEHFKDLSFLLALSYLFQAYCVFIYSLFIFLCYISTWDLTATILRFSLYNDNKKIFIHLSIYLLKHTG